MEALVEILSWIMFIGGSIFILIGAIGMLRLPDMFTRMHGAGMIDTLGAVMLFVGMMLQAGLTFVSIKIFLIILFLMFTSPTTTHALARTARAAGLKPLQVGEPEDEEEMPLTDEFKEGDELSKT